MPRGRHCRKHGSDEKACTCEMGNLYRFAEPIVLLAIANISEAYGYSIAKEAEKYAVTHSGLDTGVVYRTLKCLENTGRIASTWDSSGGGPARRLYRLTDSGWKHIAEWSEVMGDLLRSLAALKKACDNVSVSHRQFLKQQVPPGK